MKPKPIDKSEKLLLQKFNKEFTSLLSQILNTDKLPIKIDKETFDKLLRELGCFKNSMDMKADRTLVSKEASMANDIWDFMQET